ncbi:hypothetical protein QE430_001592 [Microbacterium testaceum]|nr:hypothetical protein [Microbacterium testaceum]
MVPHDDGSGARGRVLGHDDERARDGRTIERVARGVQDARDVAVLGESAEIGVGADEATVPARHLRGRVVERIDHRGAVVEPVVEPPSARRRRHEHERQGVAAGRGPAGPDHPSAHRALRVEGLLPLPRTPDADDPAPEHAQAEDDRAHTEDDRQHQHRDVGPGERQQSESDLCDAPREREDARARGTRAGGAPHRGETTDHQEHREHGRKELEAAAEPDEHREPGDDPRGRDRALPPARGTPHELDDAHDHGARADVDAEQYEGGERARDDEHAQGHHDRPDQQQHPRRRVAHERREGVPPAQVRSAGRGHQAMISIAARRTGRPPRALPVRGRRR